MIQASDLRFNNWVEKFTDWGDSLGYSPILPEEFLAIHTKPERVNPILLTEEILLKCGFEYNREKTYLENKCCGLKLMDIAGMYYRANFPIKADINHLHQLQNLYFALTGEELEIEL